MERKPECMLKDSPTKAREGILSTYVATDETSSQII